MSENFVIRAKHQKLAGFDEEIEKVWKGPFCFIQAADTQFGMIQGYIEKKKDQPDWEREKRLTRQAIQAANALKPRPKFFVVCGDLVDEFLDQRMDVRLAQEQDFKAIFTELDPEIPLVCVCGNHDIGSTPDRASIEHYKSNFGDDYFSFWSGGVFFIVVNSQYYFDPSLVPEMADDHDKWLDRQLEIGKTAKHVCIFQHIPPFHHSPDEEHEYFNFPMDARNSFLTKLKAAGVAAVFCGHYHRNAGGRYDNVEVVVTSAIGAQLGDDKHGMRVVQITEDTVSHKYHALDDFPTSVNLKNI